MMKSLIFLLVNLAVSSATPRLKKEVTEIVDVGNDMDIPDINNNSQTDDILIALPLQRSAVPFENSRWTSPVPYLLDNSLELNARGVILKAMDQFRLKSCIDFKLRDDEVYYINFQKLGGCFAYIGKVIAYGQELSVGKYCDNNAIVEHELLHTLGFFHEQSRYDRDDYVTIDFSNIESGFENNFEKTARNVSTTNGVPYDYYSVMHYGPYAFANGSEPTIITTDPSFMDVIGQRLDMSESDVLELNLQYRCNESVAFMMYCGFTDGAMCGMNSCSSAGAGWRTTANATGGPPSDHTNLRNSSGQRPTGAGYFMHASTARGSEGDLSLLETKRMTATRGCHVQCLQFYYYQTGNESDVLNIWMREFRHQWDRTGTRRLIGQITGERTFYWQLQHVPLNATDDFQVEFEVRKGAGYSSGGFSIDDINLSQTECPHVTVQLDDFETVLENNFGESFFYSPRQYSRGGYSYIFGISHFRTDIGLFIQLLSGKYDDQLEWPCPQRQVTVQLLDQTPNIQNQMSKQRSFTSDLRTNSGGSYLWGNPAEVGTPFVDENNQTAYEGPKIGFSNFANVDELNSRQFLKGGTAIFVFSFQDITPLVNGSDLPCPDVGPPKISHPPRHLDQGPCSTRIQPTSDPPFLTTEDGSVFGSSPSLLASPVSIFSLALMLLMP